MGSKKSILDFVAGELERLTEPGDILIDLMAGSHTIGYAMKHKCRIVANDIQHYSFVIGRTLLNYIPEPRFEGYIQDEFRKLYLTNRRHLEKLFEPGLIVEEDMLYSEHPPNWMKYRDFCENFPYYLRPTITTGWHEDFLLMFSRERVKAYRSWHKLEPYSLFSVFYANGYMGVRQAMELDSLRYAIDKLCDGMNDNGDDNDGFDVAGLRNILMSALLAVLSRINPGPGHWAAIPRVSIRNYDHIISYRKLELYDLFMSKVAELEKALAKNTSPYASDHIVMTEDFPVFIEEITDAIRQAKVVYLDPPYSQGHYSRFYHLPETLVRYDYPEIAFAGRYRTDRHQSPFAKKETVAKALGHICRYVRSVGTILVISYSQNGVIQNTKQFRAILEQYYSPKNIKLKSRHASHSKFGQAERMKTEEYLFICYP
ncbi:MAG: DNA adenine methylase [Candidatus Electryoneaceae bacterium]|nr:DNA adenine methylase [Candidatus Electryoneaceae bacterium]